MNGSAQSQVEVLLDRQIEVAKELATILEHERAALTGNSSQLVHQAVSEKLRLLKKFEQLEEQRGRLCTEHGLPVGPANTVSENNSGFTNTMAHRWRSLMGLMAACRNSNETNGLIVNLRRGQVRQLIDIVRGGPAITYGPQGRSLATAVRPLARA